MPQPIFVKCTKCGNPIKTTKKDECQCGNHLPDGTICGERVKVKENVIKF